MTKLLTLVYAVLWINISCNVVKTKRNKYEIIRAVVTAIADYDTLKLYQLVDTSRCFKIIGRSNFLWNVDYVYNRLKSCK